MAAMASARVASARVVTNQTVKYADQNFYHSRAGRRAYSGRDECVSEQQKNYSESLACMKGDLFSFKNFDDVLEDIHGVFRERCGEILYACS